MVMVEQVDIGNLKILSIDEKGQGVIVRTETDGVESATSFSKRSFIQMTEDELIDKLVKATVHNAVDITDKIDKVVKRYKVRKAKKDT